MSALCCMKRAAEMKSEMKVGKIHKMRRKLITFFLVPFPFLWTADTWDLPLHTVSVHGCHWVYLNCLMRLLTSLLWSLIENKGKIDTHKRQYYYGKCVLVRSMWRVLICLHVQYVIVSVSCSVSLVLVLTWCQPLRVLSCLCSDGFNYNTARLIVPHPPSSLSYGFSQWLLPLPLRKG